MAKGTFSILAILAAVALVGTLGLAVKATGGDGEAGSGLVARIHRAGQHWHAAGHDSDPLAELIDELELRPDQQRRIEKVHEIIAAFHRQGSGSMLELHEKLVARLGQGRMGVDETRRIIDEHVERIRVMAYAVADEMIPLIDELDPTQREILLGHLQGLDHESLGNGI